VQPIAATPLERPISGRLLLAIAPESNPQKSIPGAGMNDRMRQIIFIMDQAKPQLPIGSPRRTLVIMPFSCCSMILQKILQKNDGTDFHL
jgi:hypothetical protein